MKPQLILLGAPGSGKGTQAARIVSEFGYGHISTGDLLRAEVAKGSDLGNRIKAIIEAGNLVDDETVLELLKVNCELESSAYIFDGYPRNIDQAKALESVVLQGVKSTAIYFEMDLEQIIQRVINRRTAPKSGKIYNLLTNPPKKDGICDVSGESLVQRKDDNEETVRNRLNVFKDTISPIINFYKEQGTLVTVNASQSADEVFKQVANIVIK